MIMDTTMPQTKRTHHYLFIAPHSIIDAAIAVLLTTYAAANIMFCCYSICVSCSISCSTSDSYGYSIIYSINISHSLGV